MEKPEERSERLHKIRHSTAHVMAEAVRELFPGTRIAIGPAIAEGFYYGFRLPRPWPGPARGLPPRAARRRLQAAFHRRRLLAGRRAQPDAHAHLRHRLGGPPGAGRLSEKAGGDREEGPPPPGR